MTILSLLLKVCAIDWFVVENGDVRSEGALIYPPEVAEDVAELEQSGVPHLVFKIRCEEQ